MLSICNTSGVAADANARVLMPRRPRAPINGIVRQTHVICGTVFLRKGPFERAVVLAGRELQVRGMRGRSILRNPSSILETSLHQADAHTSPPHRGLRACDLRL